jgi:hypothetical protein
MAREGAHLAVAQGPELGDAEAGTAQRSAWREECLVEVAELESLASWIVRRSSEDLEILHAVDKRVQAHLRIARVTATRQGAPLFRRLAKALSRGSDLERVRGNLDAAAPNLLRIAPEPSVRGQLPLLLSKARRLAPTDPRRTALEELARRPRGEELTAADRNLLISAVQAADTQARRDLVRVRSFKTVIALAGLVVFALAAGLALLGAFSPETITLCFVPGDAVVCPTASVPISFDSPRADEVARGLASPSDIAIVELMGLLGASLAAVVTLRQVRGTSSPYRLAGALIVLKLTSGALLAVLGLLLLNGGFVPGFTALDSPAQILAWATVLGLAQQLFTRLVDKQALGLLDVSDGFSEAVAPAAMDLSTADALSSVVRSSLKESASHALREAVIGEPLVNYKGVVTMEILDRAGESQDIDQRSVALMLDQTYTARVTIAREPRRGWSRALVIDDGVEDEAVTFTIELDSNGGQVRSKPEAVTLGTSSGEAARDFPFVFAEDGPRTLWVRVRQRGEVVVQFELEARVRRTLPS